MKDMEMGEMRANKRSGEGEMKGGKKGKSEGKRLEIGKVKEEVRRKMMKIRMLLFLILCGNT